MLSKIRWKNVFPLCSSYSTIRHEQLERVWQLEKKFHREGLQDVDIVLSCSYLSRVLQNSGKNKASLEGRVAHHLVIDCGLVAFHFSVLQMYCRCGYIDDALKVFFNMEGGFNDAESWNVIIDALARQGLHKEAMSLCYRMCQESVIPNRSTFMSMILVLSNLGTVIEGNRVNMLVQENGFQTDVVVGTALVNFYGKCGNIEAAKIAFNNMSLRNVVTWTTMIDLCSQLCHADEALKYFNQMLQNKVQPDRVTFIHLLTACSNQLMILEGLQVHDFVIQQGLDKDTSIANALINLYGIYGCLEDALQVFNSMTALDIVSWSSLIKAYAEHGNSGDVSDLFERMQKQDFSPNKITFISVLASFVCEEAIEIGQNLHSYIIKKGFDEDTIISNSVINMYIKCGNLENARRTFEKMSDKNVVSWTSIIGMHAQQGECKEALETFECMHRQGVLPNKVTFIHVLEAYSHLMDAQQCTYVHDNIIRRNFESHIMIGTSILKMYGSCGRVEDAQNVFYRMVERDLHAWNTILAIYADHGYSELAIKLFNFMQSEGVLPNEATYGFLVGACTSLALIYDGLSVHARIEGSQIQPNVVTATNIVNMYGKHGSPEKSYEVFSNMTDKNVLSWTAIISAYSENGHSKNAFHFFTQMLQECMLPNVVTWICLVTALNVELLQTEGKKIQACIAHDISSSNVALGNALINMYGKCGELEAAREIFDHMVEKNVISWSGMITVYAQHNQGNIALDLFEQMQTTGIVPNEITLVSVLDVCASEVLPDESEKVHAFILCNRLNLSGVLGNSMINMYGKCGNLNEALVIFKNMTDRDIITWNAMFGAYAEHGHGKEALQLLDQMIQCKTMPDQDTLLNLLCACSHSGHVIEGSYLLTFVTKENKLNSDHCACFVDLLGRAGMLDEAETLINCFPVQPKIMLFMAFLSSCRYQTNVIRGQHGAKYALELNDKSTAPIYMLKHIYIAEGSEYDDII